MQNKNCFLGWTLSFHHFCTSEVTERSSTAGSRKKAACSCWAPPQNSKAWLSWSTTTRRSLCTARSSYATQSRLSWCNDSSPWVSAGRPQEILCDSNVADICFLLSNVLHRMTNVRLCMRSKPTWTPTRSSQPWCAHSAHTRSSVLFSLITPLMIYFCFFSLKTQLKLYTATQQRGRTSSAFPKELWYTTCSRRVKGGTSTNTLHTQPSADFTSDYFCLHQCFFFCLEKEKGNAFDWSCSVSV